MCAAVVSPGWQRYPCCLSGATCNSVELKARQDQLLQDSTRLFSGQGEIEAWYHNGDDQEPTQGFFQPDDIQISQNCIYFISQRSSWSHMETSIQTLQKLLNTYAVSPVILDVFHAFGAKVTGGDDPFFNLCHFAETGSLKEGQDRYLEICYILRSYEKHGRSNLTDPWSLRQMAVYQRYNMSKGTSMWILLQPFQRLKDSLWKDLYNWCPSAHPLTLHALLASLEIFNWRWYLNDVRRNLLTFAEKAKHSSTKPKEVDYDASFVDCQRLQTACEKLLIAQEVLAANSKIASTIRKRLDIHEITSISRNAISRTLSERMQDYLDRIEGFKRTVAALQQQTRDTETLLSKLISHRRVDLLNENTLALRVLAGEANKQSHALRTLAEKSGNDSRVVRVVTFIATLYLPASLIASIFSTGLIQLPEMEVQGGILAVQPSIWVYILSSAALTALTLAIAHGWTRRNSFKPSLV